MKHWIQESTYEDLFGRDADLATNLEVWCGFEIPKKTSKKARMALKQLAKDGVIYISHDDGPEKLVAYELYAIAGAIGLDVFFPETGSYRFVIVADEQRFEANLS